MLSKSSARLLIIAVKWTSFFGGMPFEWDDRRSKVKVTRGGWRKWWIWLGFTITNWVYSLTRHVLRVTEERRDGTGTTALKFFRKVKGYQEMVLFIILGVISYNTYSHHLEYVTFLNAFVRYAQDFRNSFVRRLRRGWKNGCETLLQLIMGVTLTFPFLAPVLFLTDPRHPRYIISLLPYATPTPIYYGFCALYATILFFWAVAVTSAISIFMFVGILACTLGLTMINEARSTKRYYFTRPSLRNPPRLCEFYRSLQILCGLCNNALSGGMPWLKASSEGWAILCNCTLIIFWRRESNISRLALFLFPNAYLVCWCMTLCLNAELWRKSGSCVTSWKRMKFRSRDQLQMRKFGRSCPPLKVHVGEFFFITPSRVIFSIHTVIRMTLKVLLTFGKKSRM